MKHALLLFFLIAFSMIHTHGYSQEWQSVVMLETRTGFTSNTYLNPVLPEWDRDGNSGYMMFTPIGQMLMSYDQFSADFTLGGVYKPFFDDRNSWSGLFGMASGRYRATNKLSLGMETGGSRFNTYLDRKLFWIQPAVIWSPSIFTQLRFRAGSSFMTLSSAEFEENGDDENSAQQQGTSRFDSYTIDLETWLDFRWQFRTSLYGNLDAPFSDLGIRGSADYRVNPTLQWNFVAGIERFRYQVTIDGGGGGGPPPRPRPDREEILDEADLILRAGTGLTWRVHQNISLNVQADLMRYTSSGTEESLGDYQISGGVRFSLFPDLGNRGKAKVEWRQNDSQTVILNLSYSGEGRLYILGNFNNWEQPGEQLTRQSGNRYAVRLDLATGVYEYKILLIEGDEQRWIDFSNETYTVPDGFGGENGLIFIE